MLTVKIRDFEELSYIPKKASRDQILITNVETPALKQGPRGSEQLRVKGSILSAGEATEDETSSFVLRTRNERPELMGLVRKTLYMLRLCPMRGCPRVSFLEIFRSTSF
jgi:hypothetical protein